MTGRPILSRVYRWRDAGAQHNVGQIARVVGDRAAPGRAPGLFVAGSGFRSVGIPDCVADGRAAALPHVSLVLTSLATRSSLSRGSRFGVSSPSASFRHQARSFRALDASVMDDDQSRFSMIEIWSRVCWSGSLSLVRCCRRKHRRSRRSSPTSRPRTRACSRSPRRTAGSFG